MVGAQLAFWVSAHTFRRPAEEEEEEEELNLNVGRGLVLNTTPAGLKRPHTLVSSFAVTFLSCTTSSHSRRWLLVSSHEEGRGCWQSTNLKRQCASSVVIEAPRFDVAPDGNHRGRRGSGVLRGGRSGEHPRWVASPRGVTVFRTCKSKAGRHTPRLVNLSAVGIPTLNDGTS